MTDADESSPPRRRRRWGMALGLVVCGLLALVIIRALARGPARAPRAGDVANAQRDLTPVAGTVELSRPAPDSGIVGGNGRVEPRGREMELGAEIAGVVARFLVNEGDTITQGEPLVEFEASAPEAALAQARAELAAAEAELAKAVAGNRPEEVAKANAERDVARARARKSANVQRRLESLRAEGAATADELDRARREAEGDRAELAAAEASARLSEAGSRKEDIALAKANVEAARAKMLGAEATLEQRIVRSPIDGAVLSIVARPGQAFSPQRSDPLLIVGDTSVLRVRMEVDERDIGKVKVGDRAFVMADAFGDARYPGRVVEVAPRMGKKTVTSKDPGEREDVEIREALVELDERGPFLPGLRVYAFIEPDGKQKPAARRPR